MADTIWGQIRMLRFTGLIYNERGHPLGRQRSLAELQRLAGRIWQDERQRGPAPAVRGGRDQSFCAIYPGEQTVIVLARGQRDHLIFLHEMAHALGHRDKLDHGPAFVKRYTRLLEIYGPADPIEIGIVLRGSEWGR